MVWSASSRRIRAGVVTTIAAAGLLAVGLGQASLAAASCEPATAGPACNSGVPSKADRLKVVYDSAESEYHTVRGRVESKGANASFDDQLALRFVTYQLAKAEDALFEARKVEQALTPSESDNVRAAKRSFYLHGFKEKMDDEGAGLVMDYEKSLKELGLKGDAATQEERDEAAAEGAKVRSFDKFYKAVAVVDAATADDKAAPATPSDDSGNKAGSGSVAGEEPSSETSPNP